MLPAAYDKTRESQQTYAKCGNKSEYFIVPLWAHSIFAIKYVAKKSFEDSWEFAAGSVEETCSMHE